MLGSILVTLFLVTLSCARSTWQNLGYNECYNGRFNETCGHGQFCSQDPIDRGCRNCTADDFHIKWCMHSPEEFRNKHPSCEVFCERELWLRNVSALQNQTESQAKELRGLEETVAHLNASLTNTENERNACQIDLAATKDSLNRTEEKRNCSRSQASAGTPQNGSYLWWTLIAVIIVEGLCLAIAVTLAVYYWRKWRTHHNTHCSPACTACARSHFARLFARLCCLPAKLRHPVAVEEGGEETSAMQPLTGSPAHQHNGTDDNNVDRRVTSDRCAPNGQRTEHHPRDADDFMTTASQHGYPEDRQ